MRNPVEFPSVGINQLYKLPQYGGVYFAMQGGDVLYIGQSVNIRKRWIGHHKRDQLSVYPDIRVHYAKSDGRSLYQQESEWLNYCRPPLNTAGPRYYPSVSVEDLREVPPFQLFYAWWLITVPSFLLACWGMFTANRDMFSIFATLFLVGNGFYLGGVYTWWVARRVFNAKVEA
jgi:hypothetical protein